MSETATRTCQVRIGTESPCLRPAAVEIEGVTFCERCARQQEAYFTVGELTQALATSRVEGSHNPRRNEPLVRRLLYTLRGLRRGERADHDAATHNGATSAVVEEERAKVGSL